MSVVLFFGTFVISYCLKNFKSTGYLPGNIRYSFHVDDNSDLLFRFLFGTWQLLLLPVKLHVKTPLFFFFRNLLSDFAVVIAIFMMTMVSYFADVHTPKLVRSN